MARGDDRLWQVAVDAPVRTLLTYRVPADIRVAPGQRVVVPLGRRVAVGVAVAPHRGPVPESLRDVQQTVEAEPVFSPELLQFVLRAAAYYMAPPGEALAAALPPGLQVVFRQGRAVLRVGVPEERVVAASAGAADAIAAMVKRAPVRAALLAFVCEAGEVPVGVLSARFKNAAAQVRRLERDGLVTVVSRTVSDPWSGVREEAVIWDHALSDAQRDAVEAVASCSGYRGFLLHGVTGSGKTEVYLRLIERTLAAGKGVVVLVPEIALTPQLVAAYRQRFGDAVAVLHSGLRESQRVAHWRALMAGAVRVAVGVRSAVFAPVRDLGLVIVDEEHDGSFKQDSGFCYHARDAALLRASLAGCPAVLGSATPSLESLHNAQTGKLQLLRLPHRVTRASLPSVELVDMARHREGPSGQRWISDPLYRAMLDVLDRGEQVILFLNRRGYAPVVVCTRCGESVSCANCAVTMTLHRTPPVLTCHYCGVTTPVPMRCPACGAPDVEPMGVGTQRIEQVLRGLFPSATVARLDRDAADERRVHTVLEQLRNKEIDILVGTQMVAKGHDIPGVTLVGVIAADTGLHMPDFRSAERTFSLLTQVAGRAGRGHAAGRAIIQTFKPDHPAVRWACTHDYDRFAQWELANRKELGYPPFGRLVLVRISSLDPRKARSAAAAVARGLEAERRRLGGPPVRVLGPAAAPLERLHNRYRWQVLLKAPTYAVNKAVLEACDAVWRAPSGVRIRVDVDPVAML